MSRIDVIKGYYEPNMKKGIADYRILGWESKEAQYLRFEALVSKVSLQGKKLLDVGCGAGNFLEYLNISGEEVDYTGVDILPCMVNYTLHKKLNGQFYCMDIFKDNPFKNEDFNIVYASGIFNINLGNNEEFLLEAVGLFLDLCSEVAGFNLLYCNSPDKENRYFYFKPEEVRNNLEQKFAGRIKKIEIIEGYLQNDFTVICFKNSH
ncbi:MAG: class I SAM-dependent methyltransferase [Clostridia bacterium]|nr:class I SAM-dependent methyltransferase [Clostridia bacterium]